MMPFDANASRLLGRLWPHSWVSQRQQGCCSCVYIYSIDPSLARGLQGLQRSRSSPPNMSQPNPPDLAVQDNGLYVLLSLQGKPGKWHWGLYLHLPDGGWIFHAIKHAGTTAYTYIHRTSPNVDRSIRVVAGLRVAQIDDAEMRDALRAFLGRTEPGFPFESRNQFGRLTCRTWVLEALDRLNQAGHISIQPDRTPQHIEDEAFERASKNFESKTLDRIKDSKHCEF